ncbi:MAG: argininosuccinate lyase [Dictyoglomus sp. NZ13-RE01]|nr:MAG: argininosuccinate lyase [Dictyoglomus sp. NZ13-RE01]
MALWESRWEQPLNENFKIFSYSLPFDRRLWKVDLLGTVAHLLNLKKSGIITEEEGKRLKEAILKLYGSLLEDEGKIGGSEDIHTFMEENLTELIGDLGKKIHTGRSRNDQVALDMRLYLREQSCEVARLLIMLLKELLNLSRVNIDLVMPGYTHLQHAQVVTLGHYFLAYFEMFYRDLERLEAVFKEIDVMPLGCGALAGSNIPLDREYTANLLSFSKIAENSLDAVSDRDFVLGFLFFIALTYLHLSRLAEEIILWSSKEFSFVELPEAFSTGSSLLPHKRNPDLCEHTRGKTGRLLGDLFWLMTTIKALPLSYNGDLQEDKESFFDALDQIKIALKVWTEFLPNLRFNKERMFQLANNPFLFSTDVAEYLVMKGVPFREAHKIVGSIVKYCEKNNKDFRDLSLEEWRQFSLYFEEDVKRIFSPEFSIYSKKTIGSPNPEINKKIIQRKEDYLKEKEKIWKDIENKLPRLEVLLEYL